MRLTIIRDDGTFYLDGFVHSGSDFSGIPDNVHALQWYDPYGEIEFKNTFVNGKKVKPSNQIIQTLPDWAQEIVDSVGK